MITTVVLLVMNYDDDKLKTGRVLQVGYGRPVCVD